MAQAYTIGCRLDLKCEYFPSLNLWAYLELFNARLSMPCFVSLIVCLLVSWLVCLVGMLGCACTTQPDKRCSSTRGGLNESKKFLCVFKNVACCSYKLRKDLNSSTSTPQPQNSAATACSPHPATNWNWRV